MLHNAKLLTDRPKDRLGHIGKNCKELVCWHSFRVILIVTALHQDPEETTVCLDKIITAA